MAITVSSIAVAGTACPWKLGSGASNINGSSGILVPYNTANWDGSAAGGGSAGQNAAYPYGKTHTHAGETSPTTLSVTPGQLIFLEYVGGTVNTGAGTGGPAGAATTGITPYPAGGCDNETFPTNVIKGYNGFNGSGVVNTSGTTVTWVSGTKFTNGMIGGTIWINSVAYVISAISSANSATTLTLATSAGTQTGVTYFFWGASTSIGGLVGAFTDAAGNIVGAPFDWASFKGVNPAGAFTFTVASPASGLTQYTGTITGGGTNLFAGCWFTVTGFTNAANNGTFLCVSNSVSQITVYNPNSIAETHAGTAQQISGITLRVPLGAAYLSLGNNDTQLYDNTGSFSLTVIQLDSVGMWAGGPVPFTRPPYPAGPCVVAPAFMPDKSSVLNSSVMMACVMPFQIQGNPLAIYKGQLYPQGKN